MRAVVRAVNGGQGRWRRGMRGVRNGKRGAETDAFVGCQKSSRKERQLEAGERQ